MPINKKSGSGSSLKDRVRQRAKEAEKKGGGNIFNFGDKKDVPIIKATKSMSLDVLPYKVQAKNLEEIPKGEEWFRRQFYIHFGIGPEKKTIVCPRTNGEKCPICEYRSELFKKGAEQSETDAIRPQLREVYNVIDTKDESGEVKLFVISRENFGKKLDEEVRENENEDVAAFPYLEGGYTLKVRFTDETFAGKSFLKASRVDFEKRDYDYPESTLEDVYDLNTIFNIQSYEEIKSIFLGISSEDSDEEELPVEEKKAVGRITRNVKKPVNNDPEPEEVEDVPEEVEDVPDSAEGECPSGYTFGQDCNTAEECESCDYWGECMDLHEELEKPKQSTKSKTAEKSNKEESKAGTRTVRKRNS